MLYWPALGKVDLNNNINYWRIIYDDKTATLLINKGQIDGVLTLTTVQVKLNTRSKSLADQAITDGFSRVVKKLQKGYRPLIRFGPTITRDQSTSLNLAQRMHQELVKYDRLQYIMPDGNLFEPMAGEPLEEVPVDYMQFPMWVQPKLDGVRMVAWLGVNGQVECRSRLSGEFVFLDHIKVELKPLLTQLPAKTILDGELYTTKFGFTEILKRVRPTKNRHEDEQIIDYHLFDLYLPGNELAGTEIRYDTLKQALAQTKSTSLKLVPFNIITALTEVETHHDQWVKNGYEGIIIRHLTGQFSRYLAGRGFNLIKFKNFVDEEGIIIGYDEGTSTELGKVIWKVKNKKGQILSIRPCGSFEDRALQFINGDEYIGKILTYKYQMGSDYDKPRFIVGKCIRDYEPSYDTEIKVERGED